MQCERIVLTLSRTICTWRRSIALNILCDMNGWGQRFRERGKELGLTEAEVARKSGVEARAYSNYVNEKREPDYQTLLRICGTLRATPNEIFGIDELGDLRIDLAPESMRPEFVPPAYIGIGTLDFRPGMGSFAIVDDFPQESLTYFPPAIIQTLRTEPEHLRVFEVEGPSMYPILHDRDRVIVDLSRRNPSQPAIFVIWEGFGSVCKWVERIPNADPPKVRIKSENPRFEPYERTVGEPGDGAEVSIVGRVVWFARQI